MQEDSKLATILAIDIVGFSALAEGDQDKATYAALELRSKLDAIAAEHGGRVVEGLGDGMILEFPKPSAGVLAGIGLINSAASLKEGSPSLRAGGHVGEVVVAGGDLLGPAVSTAARLCSQAAPNSLVISDPLRLAVQEEVDATFTPLGLVNLRAGESIAAHSYQVAAAPRHTALGRRLAVKLPRAVILASVGAAGSLAAAGAIWMVATEAPQFNSAYLMDWIESHPGVAAWVQAIGSLLALVTALVLPYLQRRALERARAQRVRPIVMSMWSAARDAYRYCYSNAEGLTRADVAEAVARARRAFEDSPTHELKDTAIAHLFRARDRLVVLEKRFADEVEGLKAAQIPAVVRSTCSAIVEAMKAEPALAATRQLREMMSKLSKEIGLDEAATTPVAAEASPSAPPPQPR